MPTYPNHPAVRSHLQSQVNFMTELTRKSYDLLSRLSDLNLRTAQQLVDDGVSTGRRMMASKDPLHMSAIALEQLPPLGEHMRSYARQWLSIMTGAQAELSRSAETHLPKASLTAAAVTEELARSTAELSQALHRPYQGNGSAAQAYGSNGLHHTPR